MDEDTDDSNLDVRKTIIGPQLPPELCRQDASDSSSEETDDDDVIGPKLPPSGTIVDLSSSKANRHFPDDDDDLKVKREEWMTVMPEKYKAKVGIQQHSVTSFCKKNVSSEPIIAVPKESDKKIASALEDYNEKKRSSTLLDIHKEKSRKKTKTDSKNERQPLAFDPEQDLQIRKLDSKQTKSVLDKAKLLNTRFSAGSSKFL